MTRPVILLSSLLIGFLLSGNAAHAAPIPSWRFEAEAITAGLREELHIFGILSNDQAATVGKRQQWLRVYKREEQGIRSERLFRVRFVPMTGRAKRGPQRSR